MGDTEVQHRNPKLVRFGLEVPKALTYHGWEPGGEYTKPLIIRNVEIKTQKIRYKLSGGHFSSTLYPQPITLSAGTSYTLPVTFRPSQKDAYEEFVEIGTSDGVFRIPILALVPRPNLSIPEYLKFGMCAICDSVTVNFSVYNTSSLTVDFSWEFSECFEIRPKSGSLAPKQDIKFAAIFSPRCACVYDTVAICNYGNDKHASKSMKVEGIGRYPHVLVRLAPPTMPPMPKGKGVAKELDLEVVGKEGVAQSELVVNFGRVPVGTLCERLVEIVNMSPVSSKFTITAVAPGPLWDPIFATAEYEGTIEPSGCHRLKLLLSPSVVAPHPLMGHFKVCAPGGVGTSLITCAGLVEGPKVIVEESCISFGNVECGKEASGILHIRNDSSVPTVFQLQIDLHSVFHAEVLCGLLGAKASQTIIVYFSPTKPIPYYRRVACLLHHQEPQFINFVGTGFTETVRPVSLSPGSIERYIKNAQRGLSFLPPEQLKESLAEGKLSSDADGSIVTKPEFHNPCPQQQQLGASTDVGSSGYAAYLSSEMDPSGFHHVGIDTEVLKFGYCSPQHVPEGKVVNITNHTNGVLMCVWMTGPLEPFRVIPEERDIPARSTASFTVIFKPRFPSQLYVRQLECFTFYKALRDYRLVEPLTITPPWCLTVKASGHTFDPSSEAFLPKVTFDSRNLVFPATLPGESSFRTAMLKNNGDMPVLFDFSSDSTGTYTMKPSHGLLQDGYQVFVLQLNPQEPRVYKHILKCRFNDCGHFDQELLLSGAGEVPLLELQNKGQLFFKPTCIGTTSESCYHVTNVSRLPVRFEWKIPEEAQSVLSVQPASGVIDPGEIQKHQWTFCPMEKRCYAFRVSIQGSHSCGPKDNHLLVKTFKSILSLLGEGSLGTIKCDPSYVDCPTMIIGTSWSLPLTLSNTGPCTLMYRLYVVEEKEGQCAADLDSAGRGTVTLSDGGGVVHAHSHVSVTATVRPTSKMCGKWLVKYQLVTSQGVPLDCVAIPDVDATLCTLAVSASYPVLSVRDLQGVGVASSLPKTMLRSMLSIDHLNMLLQDDPSSSELRYAIGTRHSMTRRVPVRTAAIVDFDFGAAPLEMGTSGFHLVMENHGVVPTEWAFQFPTDVLLEPDYWADTGQLDDEERHELSVMDHDLFTVAPKKGRLMPGESAVVTCSFKHTTVGSSRLPVLLKLNRGREVLLRWCGMTLERGQPFIHFVSHCHKFSPISIGLQSYPRQDYKLYNAGDTPISFEMDTEPLRVLKEHNYQMPIIQCLQPRGDIPPRTSATIHFVFSPLEAKTYSVDLSITFSNGEMRLITFTGEGISAPGDVIKPLPSHSEDKQKPLEASEVPAHLSTYHLAFSDVLLFSVIRRVVFVTNRSCHTLSFKWELESSGVSEVLSIQPGHGYLQPKQSIACKFSFCSHLMPAFYDLELICNVMDESEMADYRLKLEAWHKAEEEKKNSFSIVDVSTKSASKGARSQTIPRLKSLGKRPHSSDSELRGRYEALPPIGGPMEETYEEWKKKDLAARSKRRPRKRITDTCTQEMPKPPYQFSLGLRLTAHTHSLPDYNKLSKPAEHLHMDLSQLADTTSTRPQELRVTAEENTTLRIVLSQMIKDLLEDNNFLSAVQRVVNEPVPYFQQFSTSRQLSGRTEQSAHAHIYAAGLQDLLPDMPPDTLIRPPQSPHIPHSQSPHIPHSQSPHIPHSQSPHIPRSQSPHIPRSQSPHIPHSQSDLSDGGETSPRESEHKMEDIILHDDSSEARFNRHVKLLPEFSSLVENILENTLLNILKEANSGELNITGPLYLIAKPPPPSVTSPTPV